MAKLRLSYVRSDNEPFARRLPADLTATGFDVWFERAEVPLINPKV